MADENAQRDDNRVTVAQGVSTVDDVSTVSLRVHPTRKTLQVATGDLVVGTDFDYLGIVNNSATQDTLTYKLGGSGGTTIRTMVITYTAGASKVSDDLSSLAYS